MVTLDASTSPPTVVLTEVDKGPFTKGPVTNIDWIKDMRPNEFGRFIPFVALWIVKFKWGPNNEGNGQLTLALPTPSASAPETMLVLLGGGKEWAYQCGPAMAVYKCAPGAPGCN